MDKLKIEDEGVPFGRGAFVIGGKRARKTPLVFWEYGIML